MNPNSIPIQLRHCPQWVCWASQNRKGKQTKVPVDPTGGDFASTADPDTWGTFDEALRSARQPDISGIGFVFTRDDPYVGIDLDDCRNPVTGSLSKDAIAILLRLHSYTEISPSETGLHVIVRGQLPDGPRRHGSVEMYDESRFFTMTGIPLNGTPNQICKRPAAVRAVYRQYVAVSSSSGSPTSSPAEGMDRKLSYTSEMDDNELIERARNAANGEKFAALWDGDVTGYASHSEADMALCCLLGFWTNGDSVRVDQLFRESRLMREKWDDVHYADGATYGERTVERACQYVSEGYADAEN